MNRRIHLSLPKYGSYTAACGVTGETLVPDANFATCPDCLLLGDSEDSAHDARRAELDAYLADLEQQGQALVIPVKDLGAALEARQRGEDLVDCLTYDLTHGYPRPEQLAKDAKALSATRAHLARRALGVSS